MQMNLRDENQQGLSLIELLISILLASLLISFIMKHYLIGKQQFLEVQRLLAQNLEVQLVNDLLREHIRKAGFTPCLGIRYLDSLDRRNGKTNLAGIGISQIGGLHINRMSEHFTTLIKQLTPHKLLLSTAFFRFKKEQMVLVSDCYHAEVQEVIAVKKVAQGISLTLKKPLAFQYIDPVYVGQWIEEDFFVQKNQLGQQTLFYRQNHVDELSHLIHTMHVDLNYALGKTLVTVILGLEDSQTLRIETKVRA